MVEWPRPHSSVQMSVNRPVRVGVITISVVTPGTTSCFCPICGIQSEWITSADTIVNSTPRSTGRTSSFERTSFS